MDPARPKPPLVSKNYNASRPTDSSSDEFEPDPTEHAINPKEYMERLKAFQNKFKVKDFNQVFPFRTSDGRLVLGITPKPISQMKTVWEAFFKDRLKVDAKKASGFRVRFDSRKLSKPLMIEILPYATISFRVNGDPEDTKRVRKVFEETIAAINEEDPQMPQIMLASEGFNFTDGYYKVRSSLFRPLVTA